jgi:hypothetical protein
VIPWVLKKILLSTKLSVYIIILEDLAGHASTQKEEDYAMCVRLIRKSQRARYLNFVNLMSGMRKIILLEILLL